ncbi:hypothetical protein COT70_01095 [candidate division WWE3 bacterium CG09_land_8_20_14_0_10_47_33]|uniref:Methyltransferase type 11 domain-containing protein n=1 Tax=candidate division WWE3 bacterium CG_4_9_14_0_2_um_filter_48_10 TaxID=1975078 RepID=A0A2M8EKK4_UNCKA|nr:MAG: hypothetical protein COT70_01095 [candidate division WWE3 bacterium CG09_land_8_20_14_0_10_47_33]PIZ41072.1 MAG: hypothetical protein COY35_01040 [candidate division WWE3 bacterium CG_4_10_14_0_2_um_filter_47_8]PJC23230.1 MAG: hypothetical protein CO059_00105 [candidate division WWE3 bacterium CG_4_9_14_0_2_um_filter_48_10]PJE52121.1 MAG: hypothetical protein COV28_01020 [candidate division WWE3 bacterium CG10_big_fil_rev_8_21_14_0_10_48_23]
MDFRKLWSEIEDPRRRSIWPFLKECLANDGKLLEVGPGYLPKIPIESSSHFVDLDSRVVRRLGEAGGKALVGNVEDLPYRSEVFDLVCAFEVLEHIEGDEKALSEIHRVLRWGGFFVFSVPLFEEYWSLFDKLAGHERRYHPLDLDLSLGRVGFRVERFLCPRNLYASMIESKLLRPLVVSLRVFLALVEKKAPAFLLVLYKLFALSPLDQFKGVDRTPWEYGHLGEIKGCSEIIVVCRKCDC